MLNVLAMPSLPALGEFPGILNTLKKSNCKRNLALSLMEKLLKMDASWTHVFVVRIGWLIKGEIGLLASPPFPYGVISIW